MTRKIPVENHILNGNPGHKSKLFLSKSANSTPKASEMPRIPFKISPEAQSIIQELIPLIDDLRGIDGALLGSLAQTLVQLNKTNEAIMELDDYLVMGQRSTLTPNPLFKMQESFHKQIIALCNSLNLSPERRSKILESYNQKNQFKNSSNKIEKEILKDFEGF